MYTKTVVVGGVERGEGGGGGWGRAVTIYSPILVNNTSINSEEPGESLLTLLCM